MERLFTAWKLKNLEIQNRICVPPMVCFGWSDESGMVVDRNVEHYRAMAKGGPGLIIQEATCVSENGRLSRDQLGIWSDAHVPGLKRIVEAVHGEGVPLLLQIHHAGVVSETEDPVCPSDYSLVFKGRERHGRELSVVGIRLGAFEPEISDGVAHAKKLEAMGIDFINVSYGFDKEAVREKPQGYPFAEAIYGAERIRAAVSVPVFAVYGIQDGETAEAVLKQTGADMVNIGRGVLVNYNWASDVKAGRDPGKCLYCKTCMWRSDPDQCAGKLLFNRKR